MYMKSSVVGMLVAVIVLSLIPGCSKNSLNKEDISYAAQKEEVALPPEGVIKVGWIGDLSGAQATIDNENHELNTIKMLFEKINQRGGLLGKRLEVVWQDSQSDPAKTIEGVTRMISEEKIVAILGPNTSSCAIPLAEILTAARIPGIATVATNPRVTVREDGSLNPFSFRACFIDTYQGAVAGSYAREVLEVSKAAILYDKRDEYSTGLADFFEENFKKSGGEIVAREEFLSGVTDFSETIARIKKQKPELLFLPVFYYDAFLIAKQARREGLDSILMGGDGWSTDLIPEDAREALEGSYCIGYVDSNDPLAQEYLVEYKTRYKKEPDTKGYLAYDAVLMLIDAIKRAGSHEPERITKALETTNIDGIVDRITINADTHNPENKQAVIFKISDGKFEFQQKYKSQ